MNFVVVNSVEAGATASASNTNMDNDTIMNTAINAGGRKRRRKRKAPTISQHPPQNHPQVTTSSHITPTKVIRQHSPQKPRHKGSSVDTSQARTSPLIIVPLVGLSILNVLVFMGLLAYSQLSLFAPPLVSQEQKFLPLSKLPVIAPNVTSASTNSTSNQIESSETVVTSNTNSDTDVILNVCNNNGMIVASSLPVNVCVNPGRAFANHLLSFLSDKALRDLTYYLTYNKVPWDMFETGIERPDLENL